jgi:hypothetical protein
MQIININLPNFFKICDILILLANISEYKELHFREWLGIANQINLYLIVFLLPSVYIKQNMILTPSKTQNIIIY